MFEAIAELWNLFFTWAKENGDVLGTIGFLFALTTVTLTNGKIVLQRMRGETVSSVSPGALTVGSGQNGTLVDAPPPAPDYGGKIPVAVLPPTERGQYDDHFADGLADDLIADLQREMFATPELGAVARMIENGSDSVKIARDLGVKHILSTSIRRQENKIRVAVQLIDASGAVLWSDRYDATGNDLMAIQAHIAGKVATDVAALLSTGSNFRDPTSGRAFKTQDEALMAISSPKSRLIAFLLCFVIVGLFGAHRFYVGRPLTG